jgi:hypothetical protein
MKTWNIYSVGRHRGRMGAKFVGQLKAGEKAIERAVKEVSKAKGVTLHARDAATDNWRRPD